MAAGLSEAGFCAVTYRYGVVQKQRATLLGFVPIKNCGTDVVRYAVVLVYGASLPARSSSLSQLFLSRYHPHT